MLNIVAFSAHVENELKALKEYALNPENHLDMHQMSNLDAYTRNIDMLDLRNGSGSLKIIFTITRGIKNDNEKVLVRHATLIPNEGEFGPLLAQTILKSLGFEGTLEDMAIVPYPYAKNALTFYQPLEDVGDVEETTH